MQSNEIVSGETNGQQSEGVAYRPVSMLAVVALVAGFISALCLASPLLWVLPVVGIGLSYAALVDVGGERRKAGRLAALTAMALSIGFGTQAVTARATDRFIAGTRAVESARFWLDAIRQERLVDARSICLPLPESIAGIAVVSACGSETARQIVCEGPNEESLSPSWVVQARVGTCSLRITLEPTVTLKNGQRSERWAVVRCEKVGSR